MNVEENRLLTFYNQWHSDPIISPTELAKAGFYFVNQGLTVECFSCHLQISEWNYREQIMAQHKALSPTCPFVVNPATSGNIPRTPPTNIPSSSTSSSSSSTSSSSSSYMTEEARLATFENWPVSHIVTPERLARAGFYYTEEADHTKCAYCKGIVRAWEPEDDPDLEHQRHFPICTFVQSIIVPRINANSEGGDSHNSQINTNSFPNLNIVSNKNLNELGVQAHKGPKRPDYATVDSRLRSFGSWPVDLIQTPDILSEAGFYYEGLGDQVRCFHCDGGLRHWDPHDDPWTEHARWFPSCSFVKLVKGQEFVSACALEQNIGSNLEEVVQKLPNALRRRDISERELQDHMTTATVLAALSIGLDVERVRRAIREKLEETGRAYSHPDALVEAALNLRHDEEDGTRDQESSNYSNRVRESIVSVLRDFESRQGLPTDPSAVVPIRTDVSSTVSLEEENRLLKEARMCKICMDSEVGIVFLPCGHLATCITCAPNLTACPVCRQAIKATVRTFLS